MILSSCKGEEDIILSQKINDWEFEYEGEWQKAIVPGNNFSDLLKHNFIIDPFYGTNEDSLQWVAKRDWLYKSEFLVTENTLKKQNQILVFYGLDTYAKVFLNDSLILVANNMFREWGIDVQGILQKENKLSIKFEAVSEIEEEKQADLGYHLPAGNRVFTRKAGFHYGWDWGAKITPSGIWRKVELESWDNCKIKNVNVIQNFLSDRIAKLTIGLEIESATEKEIRIQINDNFYPHKLKKGMQAIDILYAIKNPELWWPNGYGDQKLYNISVSISDENELIDSKTKKIGLKKN